MSRKARHEYLFAPLRELTEYRRILGDLGQGTAFCAYGLDDSQQVFLLSAVQADTERPMIVVCPNESVAQRVVEDYNAFMGGGAAILPAREVSFLHVAASSKELTMRRLEALGGFLTGEIHLLAVPADAAMHRLMPRARFMEGMIDVEEGQRLEPSELIERLIRAGYERVELVEARGQCALRGGILDVFPIGRPSAVRVEFFDDEVDSLRDFDVMTQRSVNRIRSARMYPPRACASRRTTGSASWKRNTT